MPASAPARRRTTTRRRPKIKPPAPRRGRRLPPGMVRLDYPKVRGYIVRIGYIRTKTGWKPRYKAYFSDTRHGGKAKARAAAEAWLQKLLRTGRPPQIGTSDGRGRFVRRRTKRAT
ncbi:MAG TPA: hypothetical protein VH879_05815 [Gemmatimonadales bacterium]